MLWWEVFYDKGWVEIWGWGESLLSEMLTQLVKPSQDEDFWSYPYPGRRKTFAFFPDQWGSWMRLSYWTTTKSSPHSNWLNSYPSRSLLLSFQGWLWSIDQILAAGSYSERACFIILIQGLLWIESLDPSPTRVDVLRYSCVWMIGDWKKISIRGSAFFIPPLIGEEWGR